MLCRLLCCDCDLCCDCELCCGGLCVLSCSGYIVSVFSHMRQTQTIESVLSCSVYVTCIVLSSVYPEYSESVLSDNQSIHAMCCAMYPCCVLSHPCA